MALDEFIEPSTQVLLQYAGETVLTRTIWGLTVGQKHSHIFKQIGEQRYLSSLCAGNMENAELTRVAFLMDPYFLKSKIVMDAARAGYVLQRDLGRTAEAQHIKEYFELSDEAAPPPSLV